MRVNNPVTDYIVKSTFPNADEITALETDRFLRTNVDGDISLPSGDNILLSSSGILKVNDVPVAGWLSDGTPYFKTRIEIGNWNMDTTVSKLVPHNSINYKKIFNIHVIIRDDTDTQFAPLNTFSDTVDPDLISGGITNWDDTNITLVRRTGGTFDSPAFDTAVFNRGWLYYSYIL